MLKSYQASYHRGQIHWLDQVPPVLEQEQQRVIVVVDFVETASPFSPSVPVPQDAKLIEEYKEKLSSEQVALLSQLMGGWQLTDSATTSPYDYPES